MQLKKCTMSDNTVRITFRANFNDGFCKFVLRWLITFWKKIFAFHIAMS